MADQEQDGKQQIPSPEKSQSFKKERRDSGHGQSQHTQSNRASQGQKGKGNPSHLKPSPAQQQEGHRGGGGSSSSNNKQQGQNNQKKYAVKKRPPPKEVPQRPNDVYVGERSNFNGVLAKCNKLFEGQHSEVYLHGLGPAIPRAVNVALELKKFYQGTVDYTVNTSTVKLIDDLIPLNETTPPSQQFRKVSCVNIRVFRTVKIP